MTKYLMILVFLFILGSCNQKVNTNTEEKNSKNQSVKAGIIIRDDLGHRIDSLLLGEMNAGFSGSVIVSKGNRVILQKGYGWTDSTKSVPITPKTRFFLASTTKGVTGVVTLLAQQQGLFSISDTLQKFYPNAPAKFIDMTIHEMLIHTSGLSNKYETFGAITPEENVSLIFNKLPVENPGFIYSSAGYWLTAAIIEKKAGKPYEEFVRDSLFKMAKMNNTNFWFEVDDNDENLFAQKLDIFPPNGIAPNWGFRGSSGITTDIIDLYRYFQAVSTGKLLSKNSLAQLFGPHIKLGSGIGIGYGWFTTTTARGTLEIWSRGGEAFGHNSAIRWFKQENIVILILTNCGQLKGEDSEANRTVSDKIQQLIFKMD
jgi:CubicO group peptidase (beta-lactamase class C family)